jgi:hypothetical protein
MEEQSMDLSTALKRIRTVIQAALIVTGLLLFAPSRAQAFVQGQCGQTVTGNVTLNQDIVCAYSAVVTTQFGLRVGSDHTHIRLNGHSIKCFSATGYKNSCQGDADNSPNGCGLTCGIDTFGYSDVDIQGPGMIQGFTIGVFVYGGPLAGPSANNVKVKKVNITGPDGRSDISEPLAGPRPKSWGILVKNFVENSSSCPNWDKEDGHSHGVEVFGNAVDNHLEGVRLENASRVDVHQNFIHDNNDAGDETTDSLSVTIDPITGTVTNTATTLIRTPEESHGIVACGNTSNGDANNCVIGKAFRNNIHHNLVVDNGQNACGTCQTNHSTTTGPGHQAEGTENIDGGISLIGNAVKNDVHSNIVMGNNADGISIRNGATQNRINSNTSLMNTSTDAPYDPNTGQPTAPHFWDITLRDAPGNTINNNNRCLTQTNDAPIGVCNPYENTTWWQP